jgi:hypothetical protein
MIASPEGRAVRIEAEGRAVRPTTRPLYDQWSHKTRQAFVGRCDGRCNVAMMWHQKAPHEKE